jgi:hypothetical protein
MEDMGSYSSSHESQADKIYDKLIWTYTGKTPYKHYADLHKTELLSWDEYMTAREWVRKHFYVVNPSNRKYRNVFDELRFFAEVFGIDVFDIDPWNTIILDDMERGDERLIQAFIAGKELAQSTNTLLNLTSHAGSKHESREKGGAFRVVNQFMQLGGAAWDIKMDGQFSVYRPYRHKQANDPRVHLFNLKQRDSEIVGAERGVYKKIEFNRDRRQYYFDGICPIDNSRQEPKPIQEEQEQTTGQASIPYTPSWRQPKKKGNVSFDEHVKKDWGKSDSDEIPFS